MKKLSKLTFFAALLFLAAGVVGAVSLPLTANAQELIEEGAQGEQTQTDEQSQEEQSQSNEGQEEVGSVYSYVAQPGDSYTLMARKAVQTYGINNEVSLNEAQIIFAETNITQVAGSPSLNLGEEVEISENLVSDWIEQAQNLSEADQAAWAQYAEGVNFNTSAVGEVVS